MEYYHYKQFGFDYYVRYEHNDSNKLGIVYRDGKLTGLTFTVFSKTHMDIEGYKVTELTEEEFNEKLRLVLDRL